MLAVLLSTGAAQAQTPIDTPPVAAVEELVVTARKREESLLDVPVAVSAMGRDEIQRYAASDLTTISQQVPSLEISAGSTGSGGSFAIRGLGSSAADAGIEQSVAVNIDGAPVTRGYLSRAAFFDLQQVEVMKGPQALFFGKNSPGGVISVTSASPGSTWSGFAVAGYEFKADERYFEGGVGGPINDVFGVRLAVRASQMEGWVENLARPLADPFRGGATSPGARDRWGPAVKTMAGRLTLSFKPDETFSAVLKVQATYFEDHSAGTGEVVSCAPGRTRPTGNILFVPGQFDDPFGDCKADWRTALGAYPAELAPSFLGARDGSPYNEVGTWLGVLNIDKTFGDLTFSSTTSYYDIRQEAFSVFGGISYPIYPGYVREDSKGFSQELRLLSDFSGPLNFVVGAYYDQNDLESFDASMPFLFLPTDPATGLQIAADSRPYNEGESWSLFGQLVWDITPSLELAGGARYTHEEREGVVENGYVHPAMLPFGIFLTRTIAGKLSDNDVSPEVTLSWRPRTDMTVYAAYKTGYKSGGFSTPQVSVQRLTPEQIQFGPEQAEGIEVGVKGRFLDGRLVLNATAYDYEFTGLQLSQFDPVTVSFFIRNAASAVTRGVELEGRFAATDHLSLRGTVAYNDAHFKSYPNAPCWTGQAVLGTGCVNGVQDLSGGELPRAPEWLATAGFSYARPLTDSLTLEIHGDAKYSDDYAGNFDGNPFARPGSYVKLDGRIGVTSVDGWNVSLIGRNLTNEKILLGSGAKPGGLPGELGGSLARPREIALQLSYRFD